MVIHLVESSTPKHMAQAMNVVPKRARKNPILGRYIQEFYKVVLFTSKEDFRESKHFQSSPVSYSIAKNFRDYPQDSKASLKGRTTFGSVETD